MSALIEGKVAAIIDDTTLVLNVGFEQGVQEGTIFSIFAEHDQIKDPDTGEVLGLWEMVKAQVVATHVQPRLCTVRGPAVDETPVVGDTRPLSAMMVEHAVARSGSKEEWQRLGVRGADISGRPQAQPIAIGDRARSLSESEEEGSGVAEEVAEGGEEDSGVAEGAEEGGEGGDAPAI